ncbi:MAG: hypothetical protein C4278_01905 [Patescibacteria group bacterium]
MIYLLLFIFLFNSYLFLSLILPPKLDVLYPPSRIVVNENKIVFKGFVDKNSDLYLNNEILLKNEKGYFEKEIYLKEGINRFIIKARKFWGQETKKEFEIIYLKK